MQPSPAALLRAALACALFAAGCNSTRPQTPILLATEPPGAIVLVNGESSGFVTPCRIALSLEEPHAIELVLPGYSSEMRVLVPSGYEEAVLWPEMNTHPRNWKIPLWLNIDDFFAPVRTKAPLQPPRIFVRMKREVDESS